MLSDKAIFKKAQPYVRQFQKQNGQLAQETKIQVDAAIYQSLQKCHKNNRGSADKFAQCADNVYAKSKKVKEIYELKMMYSQLQLNQCINQAKIQPKQCVNLATQTFSKACQEYIQKTKQ